MKSADIKVGIQYAVVPSWTYGTKEYRNPDRTPRVAVRQAGVISMDRYNYDVYRSSDRDDTHFERAAKGSRNIGYKVFDGTEYWIARAQDIVCEYAYCEARWASAEAEHARVQAEQRAANDARDKARADAHEYQEKLSKNLTPVIQQLLKITGTPLFQVVNQYTQPTVSVSMPARWLERLVELALDGGE